MCLRAGFGCVFHEESGIRLVLFDYRFDVELSHGLDHRFCAFHQVLEHGRAVVVEFIFRIALQMNNLHLLDYRGFTTFSGSCMVVSKSAPSQDPAGLKSGVKNLPSRRILHSRRNLFESSSSCRSIA